MTIMKGSKYLLKKVIYFWLPVVVWALVIFLFSSLPTSPVSRVYWQEFVVKKSAHVVEYAIFTTLLYRALRASGVEMIEAGIYSIILAVLYGATDEFHQSFTPGREPKVRDVFFDTIGSVGSIYLIRKFLPIAPEKIRSLARQFQII